MEQDKENKKKCQWCNKLFWSVRIGTRYCSKRCRKARWRYFNKMSHLKKYPTHADLNGEEWKNVINIPGAIDWGKYYQVSNMGRVRQNINNSFRRGRAYPGHIMKPSACRKGYLSVLLSNKENRKKMRIHRLVALAFIPNPFDKPEINHKDVNVANNHVNNLEWVTPEENREHYKIYTLTQSKHLYATLPEPQKRP